MRYYQRPDDSQSNTAFHVAVECQIGIEEEANKMALTTSNETIHLDFQSDQVCSNSQRQKNRIYSMLVTSDKLDNWIMKITALRNIVIT